MDNTLQHVGVLGMKWGRRKARVASPEAARTKALLKTKKLDELTNEELRTVTTRLQLEKQFKDLTKKDVSKGQKIVRDILLNLAGKTVSNFIAGKAANDPNFADISAAFQNLKRKPKN